MVDTPQWQLSQQVEAGYHQFCLASPGLDPVVAPASAGPLLALDREGPAVIVTTGCAQGPVNVTVRSTQDPPASLETAGTGWEIGEQIAMDVTSDLYLLSMTPEATACSCSAKVLAAAVDQVRLVAADEVSDWLSRKGVRAGGLRRAVAVSLRGMPYSSSGCDR